MSRRELLIDSKVDCFRYLISIHTMYLARFRKVYNRCMTKNKTGEQVIKMLKGNPVLYEIVRIGCFDHFRLKIKQLNYSVWIYPRSNEKGLWFEFDCYGEHSLTVSFKLSDNDEIMMNFFSNTVSLNENKWGMSK